MVYGFGLSLEAFFFPMATLPLVIIIHPSPMGKASSILYPLEMEGGDLEGGVLFTRKRLPSYPREYEGVSPFPYKKG